MANSADTGRLIETLVWANLMAHSSDSVHIFLPRVDMGIDGIARHRGSGEYVSIQVKGRTRLWNGTLDTFIPEADLRDPRTRFVIALADPQSVSLGPKVSVFDIPTLERHATPHEKEGKMVYSVMITVDSPGDHWSDTLVPAESMAAALFPGVSARAPSPVPERVAGIESTWTGYLGETELLRRAAESPLLNAFAAFPDDEFNEYLFRHVDTGGIIGVQVKAAESRTPHTETAILIRKNTLTASPTSYVVIFAMHANEFHDHCWLVPAARIPEIAHPHKRGDEWEIEFTAEGVGRGELAAYRLPRAGLAQALTGLAAGA